MRKNLILLTVFAISIAASSCKRYLEVEPLNTVSDENPIFDLASSQTALRGTYRALGSTGYYGENWVTLAFFPGGDMQNLTTGGASNLVTVNFRADDANFSSSWNAIYNAINRANNVISRVAGVTDPQLTATLKNQYIGEAKFIRALCYFDLARGWGGVQLFLEPTTTLSDLPKLPRSSLEETYQQVLKDLTEAEGLLSPTAAINRIRVTKETVWALRARLHLYKKEWALAEQYASKLIGLPNYNLIKPYSAWFSGNAIATLESIFELQYSAINPSAIRAQMQHPSRGGTYRYSPTPRFVQVLKDAAVSGGRRALIDSVNQTGIVQWFGNLYYRNPATDPAYIFRIAEMYLIRAEARASLGTLESSLTDLNAIRSRANVPLSSANTAEDLLLAIENERRVEFAFEGHRWFDLNRTGRAKAVLEALNPNAKVDAWESVFPIPNLQVQLDPALQQNPGY